MLSTQASPSLDVWARLIYSHAAMRRAVDRRLFADHGLTLSDYEALLRLGRADEGRMRRVDLAEELLLTASGVTRLLDGLEAAGLVERAACATDRRVVYAVITDPGRERLRGASEALVEEVDAIFAARLEADELAQLAELLGRLPGAEAAGEQCTA